MHAVAEARSNIALVKYWGKLDAAFNLPAVPSLSLTVDGMITRTSVRFDRKLTEDALFINHRFSDAGALERVRQQLDRVADALHQSGRPRAEVRSCNNFPTAAGLASSASAFAALTIAASAALGGGIDRRLLSSLARQASGSAARSLFGGLVLLHTGVSGEPHSALAAPVLEPADWADLRLVIGVATEQPKSVSSTVGMTRSQDGTYYRAWVDAAPTELQAALEAVARRDLAALGECTERSALRMHACALAASPGVVYLRGVTVEGLHAIRALRDSGVPVWFTCDAGPHPKALTDADHAAQVADMMAELPGVLRVLTLSPGSGAQIIESLPQTIDKSNMGA